MITTEKLKTFKEQLDILNISLTDMLKQRSQEKLFANSDDYYNSLTACKYFPEDYFKLRLFDTEVTLHFSKRLKQFYIKIDSVKYIDLNNYNFKIFFDLYKFKISPDDKSIYIPQNYNFENITKIFGKFIIVLTQFYFSQDKLFNYEL